MKTNILFPAKVRKFAYALLIIVIIFIIVVGSFNLFKDAIQTKQLLKNTLMPLICLSLFGIQFSKYKDDDEMMLEIRLKLVINALLVGIFYLIISPLVDKFIFNDTIQEIKAAQIIMFMLLYQIFMFQIKRYSLKKELSKE